MRLNLRDPLLITVFGSRPGIRTAPSHLYQTCSFDSSCEIASSGNRFRGLGRIQRPLVQTASLHRAGFYSHALQSIYERPAVWGSVKGYLWSRARPTPYGSSSNVSAGLSSSSDFIVRGSTIVFGC